MDETAERTEELSQELERDSRRYPQTLQRRAS